MPKPLPHPPFRYILNEGVASSGIVVSNDNYRDLAAENPQFRKLVEESLLMYSWVNGKFVPPDDPLGRNGPTLEWFLRKGGGRDPRGAPCPYARKCTYGNKCKYQHPERGPAPLKSVTERLQEQAQKHRLARDASPGARRGGIFEDFPDRLDEYITSSFNLCENNHLRYLIKSFFFSGETLRGKSLSLPVGVAEVSAKKPLARTHSSVPPMSALADPAPPPLTAAPQLESSPHLLPHPDARPPLAPRDAPADHPRLDPLGRPLDRSSLYKSESALYPSGSVMYYGNWLSPTSPYPTPTQAPHLPPNPHLPLSKQVSDPDPREDKPQQHRKLERQLTLNPTYDSRLYRWVGTSGLRQALAQLVLFVSW